MMSTNTYSRLGKFRLMDWHTVKITHDPNTESKHVTFTSTIHVNRESTLTYCFSDTFTDSQILNDRDVMTSFINMYGAGSLKS